MSHDDHDFCQFCQVKTVGLCGALGAKFVQGGNEIPVVPQRHCGFSLGDTIFSEGMNSLEFFILKSGWVTISQYLPDGSRQIIRFVLPGETFGVVPNGRKERFNAAEAITAVSCCAQPQEVLPQLRQVSFEYSERYISMLEHEHQLTLIHLTNIGRRDALARVAYLLVELAVRSTKQFPVLAGVDYKIPLMQRMIADATGLTPIHVNRTLRRLRTDGYLDFHDGVLRILNRSLLDQLLEISPDAWAAWLDAPAGL